MDQKLKSYFGFAIKSRNIIYGVDNILSSKRVKLIVISHTLADSSYHKVINFATKNNIDIIRLDSNTLKGYLNRENVLACGILDKNLAQAIQSNFSN